MLIFERCDPVFEKVKGHKELLLIVSRVVSQGLMGHDTIVGYVYLTPKGYRRVWEWWV